MISRFPHLAIAVMLAVGTPLNAKAADTPDADAMVQKCFNYMRGAASESLVDMVIHRPDWERTVTIRAWTRGDTDSLLAIIAPARDKGNGTLKKGRDIWMFNPKVNRVIKLPPSMMSQSWMGSDFSNEDLAKSDTLIEDFVHETIGQESREDHVVYKIRSIPRPDAPVVWGMLELTIRNDGILLEETFFDEDRRPVKTMKNSEIQDMGGKAFPTRWRMHKTETPESYTLIVYRELKFLDQLPESMFSTTRLQNPGQ